MTIEGGPNSLRLVVCQHRCFGVCFWPNATSRKKNKAPGLTYLPYPTPTKQITSPPCPTSCVSPNTGTSSVRPTRRRKCYDNIKLSRNASEFELHLMRHEVLRGVLRGCGRRLVRGGAVVNQGQAQVGLPTEFRDTRPLCWTSTSTPSTITSWPRASEDGTAKVWLIPDGGLTDVMRDPAQTLTGHKRKVGTVNWNPTAANVLCSSSTDYAVKLWDVEKGQARNTVDGHGNIIQTCGWNYDGSLVVTACKDKKSGSSIPRANFHHRCT